MFERCSRGNALARDAQAYPFNTASIFARNGNGGGYTRIIECNQSSALGWCTTKSEHPLNREFVIYFSGQRLCDVEDVVRLASDMFSKHIVAQTPPANGWGVGGPGNQREQPQDRGLNDNVSVK